MDIINSTKISLVASEIQVMMNSTLVQTQEFVKSSDLLQATVISMLFVLAYWSIIYMDSYQPGKFPPSPLSVFDKESFHQRQTSFHLNYLTGLIIGILLFFSIYFHIF
ncbi:unnamed protein product [Chironomus riparius]|uniref:Uncharacterized protein n=1 Tax=Chironomus riparius TaxID=315576 RepID=A0A9N9WQW0_9DIPT|nr:unnamed protein product [Chironomus riparius]